jgi:hypothetical protein
MINIISNSNNMTSFTTVITIFKDVEALERELNFSKISFTYVEDFDGQLGAIFRGNYTSSQIAALKKVKWITTVITSL